MSVKSRLSRLESGGVVGVIELFIVGGLQSHALEEITSITICGTRLDRAKRESFDDFRMRACALATVKGSTSVIWGGLPSNELAQPQFLTE